MRCDVKPLFSVCYSVIHLLLIKLQPSNCLGSQAPYNMQERKIERTRTKPTVFKNAYILLRYTCGIVQTIESPHHSARPPII